MFWRFFFDGDFLGDLIGDFLGLLVGEALGFKYFVGEKHFYKSLLAILRELKAFEDIILSYSI